MYVEQNSTTIHYSHEDNKAQARSHHLGGKRACKRKVNLMYLHNRAILSLHQNGKNKHLYLFPISQTIDVSHPMGVPRKVAI